MAITITAAQSGSTFNGILLRVRVLNNAALAGTPATATQSASGAHQASVTTTTANSLVYGALLNVGSSTAFTANGQTTLIDNVQDTSNGLYGGSCRATAPTGTPGATSVGASSPTGAGGCALVEVLASGGAITEDASGSSAESYVNGTSASVTFTPPAGAVLVAMVASDANTSTVITVSGGSLTWTQRAVAQTTGNCYAGVWTAQVAPAPPAASSGLVRPAPRWFPGAPGMPAGTPFSQVPAPALFPPPPAVDYYTGTYTSLYGGPETPNAPASRAAIPPGWFPGAPGMPAGTPFYVPPVPGAAAAAAPALAPPFVPPPGVTAWMSSYY